MTDGIIAPGISAYATSGSGGTSGTNNTSGTGSTSGTNNTSSAGKSSTDSLGLGLDKDAFLKLLVAQLKYQDPLNPTDGSQYMAQLAQFATVEKLSDISKAQTDLTSWQRTLAGQNMVGKTVSGTDKSTGASVSGLVTGVKLTDTGPLLILSDGTTLGVDEVESVSAGTGTTGTGTGAANTGK